MLRLTTDQLAEVAERVDARAHRAVASRLEADFPELFARLDPADRSSRLSALHATCTALGFDYLRHCARVYAVLVGAGPLTTAADRMNFYAVLTDRDRPGEVRLRMLEHRFGIDARLPPRLDTLRAQDLR